MVHAFNASTQETEAGKFKASLVYIMNIRQSELPGKTLSQNKTKQNKTQTANKRAERGDLPTVGGTIPRAGDAGCIKWRASWESMHALFALCFLTRNGVWKTASSSWHLGFPTGTDCAFKKEAGETHSLLSCCCHGVFLQKRSQDSPIITVSC